MTSAAEPTADQPTAAKPRAARADRQKLSGFQRTVTWTPTAWLLLFFALPFLIVLRISIGEPIFGVPPVSPLFETGPDGQTRLQISLESYRLIFGDRLYLDAFVNSVSIALITTVLALLVGFPVAYAMARANERWQIFLLVLVVVPFWTSLLLRIYAWTTILNNTGLINNFLIYTGLIEQPVQLIKTEFAIYIGLVYSYLPFIILPIYATLARFDWSLLEAAEDLGSGRTRNFFLITLPLAFPGVLAGCLLVFIPTVGEFVIPTLLGPSQTYMIGSALWTEFFLNADWPAASALAMVTLVALVAPIMLLRGLGQRS